MQSPGMAQYFSQGMMAQEVLTSQYSILHHERLYLLKALAEEENKGERLTQVLSALQSRVNELEAADSASETKKLRQQIKAIRNRIGACQHRERALAANLASIAVQMEGMKRYQWRNAQQEYAMQIQQAQQHAQMVLMSPARPQFALRSPGPADLGSQMQYMSLGHSPIGHIMQCSTLNPYTAIGQSTAASQYITRYTEYLQAQQFYPNSSPVLRNLEAFGGLIDDNRYGADEPISPMSGTSPSMRSWGTRSSRPGRQRAVSLLMLAQASSASANALFFPTKPRNDGALRSLSLLDGTSAAIQLQRKAAEARSKELGEDF